MAYRQRPLRLKIQDGSHAPIVDELGGNSPELWRATDWLIDVLLTDTQGDPIDLTAIARMTLEVKATLTGVASVSVTVSAESITSEVSLADWSAGTAQHATFSVSRDFTALDLASAEHRDFVLTIRALTAGSPGKLACIGTTKLRVQEGGVEATGSPTPNDPDYYTAAAADARFVQSVSGGNGLVSSGGLNPTLSLPAGNTDGQTLIWSVSGGAFVLGTPGITAYATHATTGKHKPILYNDADEVYLGAQID